MPVRILLTLALVAGACRGQGVSPPAAVGEVVKTRTEYTLADGRKVVVETSDSAPVAAPVRQEAAPAPAPAPVQAPASRLTVILNLPADHQAADGTITRMTLRESVARGGPVSPAYAAWARMTPEEVIQVNALLPAKVVVAPIAQPMPAQAVPAPRPFVGTSPTTTRITPAPAVATPALPAAAPGSFVAGYQMAPTYTVAPSAAPRGDISTARSLGVGIGGPRGGGVFVGYQGSRQCVGNR